MNEEPCVCDTDFTCLAGPIEAAPADDWDLGPACPIDAGEDCEACQ